MSFQSHLDGSTHFITPETAIEIEEALGADIMMAFDHCVALPAEREVVRDAVRRTTLWAQRCQASRRRTDQALFGIVQGGLDADLRVTSARDLVGLGFEGYAVGGLSVGESKAEMYAMLDVTVPELPASKPRYLMGVGMPEDLIEGAARGIDLFDCVVPSRHGRTGSLFTSFGRVVIKQARYVRDEQPIDPACGCPVCARYSRAYLHHLFQVKEMLSSRLNTIHNLWYFADLMGQVRSAIAQGTLRSFRDEFYRSRDRAASDVSAADWLMSICIGMPDGTNPVEEELFVWSCNRSHGLKCSVEGVRVPRDAPVPHSVRADLRHFLFLGYFAATKTRETAEGVAGGPEEGRQGGHGVRYLGYRDESREGDGDAADRRYYEDSDTTGSDCSITRLTMRTRIRTRSPRVIKG